jgi:hypothetical protein
MNHMEFEVGTIKSWNMWWHMALSILHCCPLKLYSFQKGLFSPSREWVPRRMKWT